MSNIEIKHLFRTNRFPESEIKLCLLFFYAPFGVILFILRIILLIGLLICGSILSETQLIQKFLNKIACLSLGIIVQVENPEAKENVNVYISNSVSLFDHLALQAATGSLTPGIKNSLVKSKGFGAKYFGSQSNLDTFKKTLIEWVTGNKVALNFTPEGKMTNGKGVLKFKTLPFQISTRVQPIALKIERPVLEMSVNRLGSSNLVDCIVYMFSPVTVYKLKFLPALENKSNTVQEFAEIVRQHIATSLMVPTPNFSASDLIEFEKKTLIEEQRAMEAQSRAPSQRPELQRMSMQVKEVLPHVPLKAIYNDLCITKSIDTTITNILEGRVHFISEPIPSTSASPQPSTSSSLPSAKSSPAESSGGGGGRVMFNTAASSFPKSASERNKSFQERKDQLIANARRRYIEKHNLDLPLY
ncbi:unnamed protein product [Brassicogethes aeneus]|uniref:Lipid droplet-regulating VLDL assembly factor AUP1 n=1 Tax=Brassicogethes aeneus TaxID=1431903 RepID=A0A9P0AP64_BRAAE|nr:unnamed protein product [Brassicogethes aeneus]